MRGDKFHNQTLVGKSGRALQQIGAEVFFEFPIRGQHSTRYMDFYSRLGKLRIGGEGVQKPWTVWNEVSKAEALKLHILFLITPTSKIARAVRRQLTECAGCYPGNLKIVVLPFGAALQVLRNKGLLMSVLNVRHTLIHKIPSTPSQNNPIS